MLEQLHRVEAQMSSKPWRHYSDENVQFVNVRLDTKLLGPRLQSYREFLHVFMIQLQFESSFDEFL